MAQRSVGQEVWKTGAWRLYPLMAVYVTCSVTVLPMKPQLLTNFFASRFQDAVIHCEDFAAAHAPQACVNAHAQVIMWSSWADFVSSSILLLLLAPVVGHWTDVHGRKPFIVLTCLAAAPPVLCLVLYVQYGLSLMWYFPASMLDSVMGTCLMGVTVSYTADLVSKRNRTPAFGLLFASYLSGLLAGPVIGGLLDPVQVGWLATGGLIACSIWTLLFVQESLDRKTRLEAIKHSGGSPGADALWAIWHGLELMLTRGLFVKLGAVAMLHGITSSGLWEVLQQYLQLRLGFTTLDQSYMMIMIGAAGVFMQAIGLQLLLRVLGETKLIRLGVLVYGIEEVLYAFVANKTMGICTVLLGGLGNTANPAIASILSAHTPASQQGMVQGALSSVKALAQGVGPLIYSGLFSLFSHKDSKLPYFPGAPLLLGACFMLAAFVIACTVDSKAADHKEEDPHDKGHLQAPLVSPDEEAGPSHSRPHEEDATRVMDEAHLQPPSMPLVLGHVEIPFDPVALHDAAHPEEHT